MPKNNWVFVYGSLLNRESLERTLQRVVDPEDMIPAYLKGWERSWCVTSPGCKGRVYLGLVRNEEAKTLGCLLRAYTANRDIEKLDAREGLYRRFEVNPARIESFDGRFPSNARFLVYIPQFRVERFSPSHYISIPYAGAVNAGIQALGEDFTEQFEVAPSDLPLVMDEYRR